MLALRSTELIGKKYVITPSDMTELSLNHLRH